VPDPSAEERTRERDPWEWWCSLARRFRRRNRKPALEYGRCLAPGRTPGLPHDSLKAGWAFRSPGSRPQPASNQTRRPPVVNGTPAGCGHDELSATSALTPQPLMLQCNGLRGWELPAPSVRPLEWSSLVKMLTNRQRPRKPLANRIIQRRDSVPWPRDSFALPPPLSSVTRGAREAACSSLAPLSVPESGDSVGLHRRTPNAGARSRAREGSATAKRHGVSRNGKIHRFVPPRAFKVQFDIGRDSSCRHPEGLYSSVRMP
jgi:hypothetical protein